MSDSVTKSEAVQPPVHHDGKNGGPDQRAPARTGPPAEADRVSGKPTAQAASRDDARDATDAAPTDAPARERFFSTDFWSRFGSMVTSTLVHIILLLILALLALPTIVKTDLAILLNADATEEMEEFQEIEVITDVQDSSASTSSAMATADGAAVGELSSEDVSVVLDQSMEHQLDTKLQVDIGSPLDFPEGGQLTSDFGDIMVGVGRAVVDNYDQAFDRLTSELLGMLEQGPVMVIWVFDQSESMKDDQLVIRERIDRVYAELGLNDVAQEGNLATGVTSYGKDFAVHLRQPSTDVAQVKAAIDQVPTDSSGEEMMCRALATSIDGYRDFARRTQRRTALILVSDESGNRDDNDAYLEPTIQLARESGCRIYVLGRESVFGYPYAHITWQHPQTFNVHYIPVDRGPESAYVEQLQTEGFHVRHDSLASGYGPYEQSRLSRETGGIFFMLPNVELDVIGVDDRRYRLDQMRPYRPDLRDRATLLTELKPSVLRSGLLQIIYDMNPYDPEAAKIIEMRVSFSPNIETFTQQVRTEQAKIIIYMQYLDRTRTALENVWDLRAQEADPRWQANADLMRAQLLAYKIRLYEYGAYLEYFLQRPQVVPMSKPSGEHTVHFIHWSISRRPDMLTTDITGEYLELAKEMFAEVIRKHPGTPWAARAEKEMSSGFGVELTPYYQRRPGPGGGNAPLIPVPKL